MKKTAIILAAAAVFGGTSAYAAVGDIIEPIYSTDILTYMDGVPIQGYNIGGETMIALEDLADYGYTVAYDDSVRTLIVNKTHEPAEDFAPQIERGTVGEIVGYTYETDISAVLNGTHADTVAIDGKLAASVEDLGTNIIMDSVCKIPYSRYFLTYTYDDDVRCLYLSNLSDGTFSYEEQIAAIYNYADTHEGTIRNINRIQMEDVDIVTFEKLNSGQYAADYLIFFYHNGLFINMSEILGVVYDFSYDVSGASSSLTVYDGVLSEDYSVFTFNGDKYKFVSHGPGLHSTAYYASGSYVLDVRTGIVTTLQESVAE